MSASPSRLRVTILEFLLLILIVGIGLAGMRSGGILAQVALGLTLTLFIAMAVAAFVGQGRLRLFAIGFVVASGIYGGLTLYFGVTELGSEGRLPTTQALEALRQAITRDTFTEVSTKETMTLEEARAAVAAAPPNAQPEFDMTRTPDPLAMMSISHALIGMFLGYAGGKFAVAIGKQRPNDAES